MPETPEVSRRNSVRAVVKVLTLRLALSLTLALTLTLTLTLTLMGKALSARSRSSNSSSALGGQLLCWGFTSQELFESVQVADYAAVTSVGAPTEIVLC